MLEIGDLAIDLEKRVVTVGGRAVQLTPHEFDAAALLARNEGKLLDAPDDPARGLGPGYGDESHYLHVYVSQLRRKIEPDPTRPRYLLTEPGAGYRLVDPALSELLSRARPRLAS